MNKYFTPDISDIRVGYECEYLHEGGIWLPGFGLESGGFPSLVEIKNRGINILRVPYLTKEAIEKEGWGNYRKSIDAWFEKEGIILREDGHHFSKIKLQYGFHDCRLKITPVFVSGDEECFFEGECKDINTFRYILKLLKI